MKAAVVGDVFESMDVPGERTMGTETPFLRVDYVINTLQMPRPHLGDHDRHD